MLRVEELNWVSLAARGSCELEIVCALRACEAMMLSRHDRQTVEKFFAVSMVGIGWCWSFGDVPQEKLPQLSLLTPR